MIIAAYNAESTIERAIGSALGEADCGAVLVVDDASTDRTVARARAADDGSGRLQILLQSRNAGPSAARNRALAAIDLPWIGILDADDYMLPGRLAALLAVAGDAEMVADDMWQVDEAAADRPLDEVGRRLLDPPLSAPWTVDLETFVMANVSGRGRQRAELGFLKPLIQRSFLAAHGLRYCEDMRLGEDFELYARILGHGGRLLLAPSAFYVSVVREGSLSGRHTVEDLRSLRDSAAAAAAALALTQAEKTAFRRHYRSIDCRLQWRLLILAVKQRNGRMALAAFCRPWPVPLYLLGQLLNQACVCLGRAQ